MPLTVSPLSANQIANTKPPSSSAHRNSAIRNPRRPAKTRSPASSSQADRSEDAICLQHTEFCKQQAATMLSRLSRRAHPQKALPATFSAPGYQITSLPNSVSGRAFQWANRAKENPVEEPKTALCAPPSAYGKLTSKPRSANSLPATMSAACTWRIG